MSGYVFKFHCTQCYYRIHSNLPMSETGYKCPNCGKYYGPGIDNKEVPMETLPRHPQHTYQGDSNRCSHIECSVCRVCPPHPADVSHLFSEANEHYQLTRSIKEFLSLARGIIPSSLKEELSK